MCRELESCIGQFAVCCSRDKFFRAFCFHSYACTCIFPSLLDYFWAFGWTENLVNLL